MNNGIGDAIGGMVTALIVMLPLSVLGIWKIVEIIIWIARNVSIVIGGQG